MKIHILFVMGFASSICFADAAITNWTAPAIATKDGSGTVTAPEDKAVAAAIVTLAVTGATTPTFSIVSQPASAKLVISTADLVLDTGKNFDFETETSYVVVVKCVDTADNTATGTATATITITITNVNEPPVFASSQYAVTIPDASGAGTTLTTAVAMDQDVGNAITYTIQTGNTDTVFKIGMDGEITIDTGKTLDAETVGGYQLVVHAVDDDSTSPKTGTATVWVAVKTCSSNSAALIACMMTVLVALFATLL